MKNPLLDHLRAQLQAAFDGQAWYGYPLMQILNDASGDQAQKRLFPEGKTIARYVEHMLVWRRLGIRMLQGETGLWIDLGSPENWPDQVHTPYAWRELLADLEKSQEEIWGLLAEKDDTFIQQIVPGFPYSYAHMLAGLSQHDVYHLGQIMLIVRSGS